MYLKIENKGICPIEGFTIFGATTKTKSSVDNKLIIGTFGSGAKHSLATLLRNRISVDVFCGMTRLQFFQKEITISGETHYQVCVNISGKIDDADGNTRQIKRTDDLGFTLAYGRSDWHSAALALREFVSNALDGQIESTGDFAGVCIEVVDDNQVRAKAGTTRVFVNYDDTVEKFHHDIPKWFLHFSDPAVVRNKQRIIAKRNAVPVISVSDNNRPRVNDTTIGAASAAIYRRGVFVRTINYGTNYEKSLYDYNIDIQINESRTFNDFEAKCAVAKAWSGATQSQCSELLLASFGGDKVWETTLDSDYLSGKYCGLTPEKEEATAAKWKNAARNIMGENGVLCSQKDMISEMVERKGYKSFVPSTPEFLALLQGIKVQRDLDVLSENERENREILPVTDYVETAFAVVWGVVVEEKMTCGKDVPELCCYYEPLQAGSRSFGLYWTAEKKIGIHREIADGKNEFLLSTMLEEVAHHCSGATDGSRDFADYVITLAARLIKKLG